MTDPIDAVRFDAIRLVLFDLDGTLVDSQEQIVAAMAAAFDAHDLPPPDRPAVRAAIGLSLPEVIARLAPNQPTAGRAALVDAYRQAFLEQSQGTGDREPLFPGTSEILARLEAAGYLMGIATGKSTRGALAVLDVHGLAERFVTVQTADVGPGKPHPDMLYRAMAAAGAPADGTVFVGDTTFDMQTAVNAGVAGIGVGWGYHPSAELRRAGAHAVIDRFDDLPSVVARLIGGQSCV